MSVSSSGLDLVRVRCKFGIDKEGQKLAEQAFGQTYMRSNCSTSKFYDYQALSVLEIKKGDMAVVNTPVSGWTLVSAIDDPEPLLSGEAARDALKWIYAKVDFGVTMEAINKVKQRAKIMQRLSTMAEDARKRIDITEVLKDNPEALELIKQLDSL